MHFFFPLFFKFSFYCSIPLKDNLTFLVFLYKIGVHKTKQKFLGYVTNDHLDSFALTTDDEIRKIFMRSPSRSCSLDPLPTWLVKEGIDTFIPILTKL